MDVGVCTNGTDLGEDCIAELVEVGGVHVNVSLDGFRPESHGTFRGNAESFFQTVDTIRRLSRAGLLQGLLCTPNNLAEEEEYRNLCEFAVDQGAQYVLMNPLGSMGRGVKSRSRFAESEEHMQRIYELTAPFEALGLEMVHIRFPNTQGAPLAGCEAGTIIYVFTPGEVTVCPYLVFAARTPQSKHDPGEFIVGNIFTDRDIAVRGQTHLLTFNFGNQAEVDEMVVSLMPALAAIGFGQLDLAVFNPVDGADMHAVRADHFHVFFDVVHLNALCRPP